MRILMYRWKAYNYRDIEQTFLRLGHTVDNIEQRLGNYDVEPEFERVIEEKMRQTPYDMVFTVNYFALISNVCERMGVRYVSWTCDNPLISMYHESVFHDCNYIFTFDKTNYLEFRGMGVKHIWYLPLAVDTDCFEAAISQATPQEKERFRCDISFVGSLYTDEHNYYDRLFGEEDAVKQEDMSERAVECSSRQGERTAAGLAAIASGIIRQCFAYHDDYLRQAVTDGTIDLRRIQVQMEKQGLMLGEDYYAKAEDILLAAVLEKKVTVEERRILLTQMAGRFAISANNDGAENRGSNFRLYTGSDTAALPELDFCNCGTVDYHTQMPLVFAGSRINLNISLRSIHAGIPLRVLDIMACGGFVLSNWQPEIAEYFEEGVEIVTFDSLDDCLTKTAYYLSHEEERRQIAANGKRKVQEKFSYQVGLERLFG